jgi:hypothetical protein
MTVPCVVITITQQVTAALSAASLFLSTAIKGQVKLKFTQEQATKDQRVSRGIALLFFLTSALNRVGGQCHVPAALSPGRNRYPLYRRLGGPQGK